MPFPRVINWFACYRCLCATSVSTAIARDFSFPGFIVSRKNLQWLRRLLQVHCRHPDLVAHFDHHLVLLLQRNLHPLTLLLVSVFSPCLCPYLWSWHQACRRQPSFLWPLLSFAFGCRWIRLARRSIALLQVMLL